MIDHAPTAAPVPETSTSLDEEAVTSRRKENQVRWTKMIRVSGILEKPEETLSSIALHEGFAKTVQPDELCREPGNGGRPLDPMYVENSEKARNLFVNALADDSLYRSPDGFGDYLKNAHSLAAANDIYAHVGENKRGLSMLEIGVFRPAGQNVKVVGSRRETARQVAEVAAKYNDPYTERFTEPRKGASYVPNVPDLNHLPKEGRIHDFAMGPDSGYMLTYPDGKYIPAYMELMTALGKKIEAELHAEQPDKEKAVRLIGKQYSYGAMIRPFAQINNSLFMNLANAQLKLFGLDGVSHGILDHAAQRMQTRNFSEYFTDRVFGRER